MLVTSVESDGGLYTMFRVEGAEHSVNFCTDAAQNAKVGLAPGSAFDAGGEGLIRLCHARSLQVLEEAIKELS